MKRTQLEKLQAARLISQTRHGSALTGAPSTEALDRRERRRRDAALGLVPFAVKLEGELVRTLHARAAAYEGGLNALVAELLRKGLSK